jgi:glutaminyl-peptide cyclotransferase
VKGEIYANVWQTNLIARIDPATGAVKGVINLTGLDRLAGGDTQNNVLNGIAYDSANDRLLVTGKRWSKLFEIKLKPR